MYETYPKSSANPSKSVGEQREGSWPESSSTHYPAEPQDGRTVYNGDRSRTKHCKGGSGSAPASDYPSKKYETFGTEKVDKR